MSDFCDCTGTVRLNFDKEQNIFVCSVCERPRPSTWRRGQRDHTWYTSVTLVCTNKKRHRPVVLRKFGGSFTGPIGSPQSSGAWAERTRVQWADHSEITIPGAKPLEDSYQFECSRCRRTPQLSKANLVKLLDGFRDTREPVDLSYLPF